MNEHPMNATLAWAETVSQVIREGREVAPRGQPTLELLQHTMVVDVNHPVVSMPTRKLSEKFLGAEAYWILTGDDKVENIAPFNKNISQFSDNGVTFFGAYGPKLVGQLEYVVNKLVEDRDSRQAGLTLWRENPPASKDVPCTIAMFFNIRDGKLNSHVFMRSSDVWLGVPYDVFNFSMVNLLVCCQYNREQEVGPLLEPGSLYLTAASRHLYKRNLVEAEHVLSSDPWTPTTTKVPRELFLNEPKLLLTLNAIRRGDQEARWWRQVVR